MVARREPRNKAGVSAAIPAGSRGNHPLLAATRPVAELLYSRLGIERSLHNTGDV